MPLKPIQIQQRFTALVIGDAGIGKTSLLRTIPENEKAFVLSAEAGLLCVRDLMASGRIQGFEIQSFQDMKESFQYLAYEANGDIQWVFIDSLTEISSRCVEAMKAKHVDAKDTFKLWGEYADLMTMLIKGFRDLQKYSVVFTCLPSVEKDELNRRYIGPAVAGSQLKERLTSYFDECLYMTTRKTEDGQEHRCFITQPYERYPAKDRSGRLDIIEKPDLSYIKNKILGG